MPQRQGEELFSTLQVYLPVSETDDIRNLTYAYGQDIFGAEMTSAITRPIVLQGIDYAAKNLVDSQDENERIINGTGQPRLKVYNKSELPILFCRSAVRMKVSSSYRWLSNEIERNGKTPSELRRKINNAGVPLLGIADLDQVRLVCDRLEVQDNLDTNSQELVLVPEQSKVIEIVKNQTRFCFEALVRHNVAAACTQTAKPHTIPLARFPRELETANQEKLKNELMSLLPIEVILHRIKTRNDTSADNDLRRFWHETSRL